MQTGPVNVTPLDSTSQLLVVQFTQPASFTMTAAELTRCISDRIPAHQPPRPCMKEWPGKLW